MESKAEQRKSRRLVENEGGNRSKKTPKLNGGKAERKKRRRKGRRGRRRRRRRKRTKRKKSRRIEDARS